MIKKNRDSFFKEFKAIQCILNEGDMVYFPSDWWHAFYAIEPETFSVSNAVFNVYYLRQLTHASFTSPYELLLENLDFSISMCCKFGKEISIICKNKLMLDIFSFFSDEVKVKESKESSLKKLEKEFKKIFFQWKKSLKF